MKMAIMVKLNFLLHSLEVVKNTAVKRLYMSEKKKKGCICASWYCSVYIVMTIHIILEQRMEVTEWNGVSLVYEGYKTTQHPQTSLCSSDCIDQWQA